MNTVIVIGNICFTPELRYTPKGTAVSTVRLAVPKSFEKNKSDFMDVICWKNMAEYVTKYTAKGTRVAVRGHLQSRNWLTQSNEKREKLEIVANEVKKLDNQKDQQPNDGFICDYDEEPIFYDD